MRLWVKGGVYGAGGFLALPIKNRRYGRLKICATTVLACGRVFVACDVLSELKQGQPCHFAWPCGPILERGPDELSKIGKALFDRNSAGADLGFPFV